MKRNHYIFLGMAFIALSSTAQAQTQPKDTTLNRTVIVEQEYNPIIMDASKVNVLPKVEELAVNKKEVEYAISSTPASDIPAGTMQAYTGKETQPVSKPGYVRLGYGNDNNLDAYANYLFRLSGRDKLNVNFNMTGMNSTLDMPSYRTSKPYKWDAFYYRTRANVDYLHQFGRIDLNVAGHFGLSNFNYRPASIFNKQKFTSGDMHVGLKSTDETLPLQFRAETNLMLYNRQQSYTMADNVGVTETMIRTKADVTGAINEEQLIGIAAEMNNLLYDPRQMGDSKETLFENRTTVNLNPYYELSNDSWRLHIGANVDFSFKGGKSFYASPDIDIDYVFSDSYVLYAQATGGRMLNDFRRLEQVNPYACFSNLITDTYEQLNARIGFKASPVTGLWFNLFGGYQNLKNDLYPFLNEISGGHSGVFTDYAQTNSYNFQAGAQLSYAYKDLFSFSADATYYHWDADDPSIDSETVNYNEALLMKPQCKLGLQAEARPIPALLLNIGYQYIYRGEPYFFTKEKLPAVSNLSLGVTYHLFKGISIYAKADNILNKEYQYYLDYPTQGINFVGGLSFQF
ncbi:TonB-dependent receptor [Bacteroides sp.]